MKIYLGSDHGGYALKGSLATYLTGQSHEVVDCGSYSSDSTDYPDFAVAVGRSVQEDASSLGILVCRSGEGMEIAANKLSGIRAALVWRPEVASETRNDNDANVLVLPADYLDEATAKECASRFISTPFSHEERHVRRLEKITSIEKARYDS